MAVRKEGVRLPRRLTTENNWNIMVCRLCLSSLTSLRVCSRRQKRSAGERSPGTSRVCARQRARRSSPPPRSGGREREENPPGVQPPGPRLGAAPAPPSPTRNPQQEKLLRPAAAETSVLRVWTVRQVHGGGGGGGGAEPACSGCLPSFLLATPSDDTFCRTACN